jgi:hypothetical protein
MQSFTEQHETIDETIVVTYNEALAISLEKVEKKALD